MWISIAVFVLLTIGIVAICDIRFTALFERLVKSHGGSTLAEDLEVMSGNTPTGFFKRESYEVEQILKATGVRTSLSPSRPSPSSVLLLDACSLF